MYCNYSATYLISKSIHTFKLFAQNLINIHELNLHSELCDITNTLNYCKWHQCLIRQFSISVEL